jgi:hypothetical protein
MTTATDFDERIARYERLKRRTLHKDEGGEGMTRQEAGDLERPPLTRARVSAILRDGPPKSSLGGRPAESTDRENVRARIRYWRAKGERTTDAEARAAIDATIARLEGQLE